MLVRLYANLSVMGLLIMLQKNLPVADQESAVKKDRSTEDGEKNDKISLDASCKKSRF